MFRGDFLLWPTIYVGFVTIISDPDACSWVTISSVNPTVVVTRCAIVQEIIGDIVEEPLNYSEPETPDEEMVSILEINEDSET